MLAQSAKPAVVMMYSSLLLQKKFRAPDYAAVLVMVAGLCLFVLGDAQTTPSFDPFGVPLISLSLVIDAGIGPVQEKCFRNYDTTKPELLAWAYGGASAFNSVLAVVSGDM